MRSSPMPAAMHMSRSPGVAWTVFATMRGLRPMASRMPVPPCLRKAGASVWLKLRNFRLMP